MKIIRDFISPNSDSRPTDVKIDYVIVHYTEMLFEDALAKLCDKTSNVSCHYLIKETGEIFQLVDDARMAWHAGQSYWRGTESLNRHSIGIELDNLGDRHFTEAQMQSCIGLCQKLIRLYDIPQENILGHSDIAPNRKIDPGIYFDWELMAQHGLGMWYGDKDVTISSAINDYTTVQATLKKIGYQINVTGEWDPQTNNCLRAFQSHFCQQALVRKGLDFYRDPESEYFMDAELVQKLNALLK
jgi:N-acetylmuramoyl-L-alanine amidase